MLLLLDEVGVVKSTGGAAAIDNDDDDDADADADGF